MAVNFGMPYKGSKSKIARDLIGIIPSGERFVDVFAGGCAMSHAALLAGRWKNVLANDITDTPQFFVDVLQGKYKDRNEWISREDFFRLKDSDPFVRYCYSFGNDGKTYMYSQEIEPYKKARHYATVFDDWTLLQQLCPEVAGYARISLKGITDIKARRLHFGPAVVRALKMLKDPGIIERNPLYKSVRTSQYTQCRGLISLERLERLQNLERLERLQSLKRPVGTITARKGDYRTLKVQPGDVLYCDPPYKDTTGYNGQEFDNEAFYDWACAQTVPVYISEYDMPRDRFLKVWEKKVQSQISAKGGDYAFERLYVPRKK
ncbi:MAG: DNA adenine methylase [Bacteroidales bacterium]|nr:DNA adenine methylase [Bacteroidales bacterium]